MHHKSFHKSFKSIIAIVLVLFVAISCNRNTVQISTYENIKVKDLMTVMDTSFLEFDELKARFKIKADLNGNSRSFNADIRWEKEEQIWMSFSIFGFEGLRALFTQDSVHIINKLEKQYYFGDYKSLEQISQVALSFNEIENLLLGRILSVDDKKPAVQVKGKSAIIEMEDELYKAKISVDKSTLSIQHYLITSWLENRSLDVTLSDYQQIENKNWPKQRDYNIISGSNYLKIDATSQKVALNETLEYPFYINPKYEKIPLEDFQ